MWMDFFAAVRKRQQLHNNWVGVSSTVQWEILKQEVWYKLRIYITKNSKQNINYKAIDNFGE